MTGRSPWVRFWYVWSLPALVVAFISIWLFGFRGAVLGSTPYLKRQVEQQQRSVARLEGQKRTLQNTADKLDALQKNLTALKDGQLGKMSDRLVPFLVDVMQRTREANLLPDRISYSAQQEEKTGVVHFIATYTLTGRYEQIRQLVYLLEDSPQFVIIERLGLRGQEQATSLDVTVQLAVGTYFSEADEELMRQYGVEVAGAK